MLSVANEPIMLSVLMLNVITVNVAVISVPRATFTTLPKTY
jgi:hypothetical protein